MRRWQVVGFAIGLPSAAMTMHSHEHLHDDKRDVCLPNRVAQIVGRLNERSDESGVTPA